MLLYFKYLIQYLNIFPKIFLLESNIISLESME